MRAGLLAPLAALGILLSGCATMNSLRGAVGLDDAEDAAPIKRLHASVMPRDPGGHLKSGLERSRASVQPSDAVALGTFMRDARTGASRRFATRNGDTPLEVTVDGALFLVASGAECRNAQLASGNGRARPATACSLDGRAWFFLNQLIGG